ncbi:MAG: methyltransferase [Burkholderiales bacterium]|nr:methyltransferase [Burkholderiales bacterium]
MSEMFGNRLRKNAKHLSKWGKRRGISCYRLYERDIQEYPYIVDFYEGRVHLQSLSGEIPDGIVPEISRALELPLESIHCKQRGGQKEGQYLGTGKEGDDFVVSEGGNQFIVNLDAYLDTGLFLDHRNMRKMIGERAFGKRFLNLFAYTGSFSVYAAKGGAISTTTVDLSNTYLDWAKRNFVLNGMDLNKNILIRSDVKKFLEEWKGEYDLIVLDPPTFSNSKKMEGNFDVQRDHVSMIEACMRLLAPGGALYFSNNLRSFRLDEEALSGYEFSEISAQTVPEDFRNRKIHRSWVFTSR